MNAVEIEESISILAAHPFDESELVVVISGPETSSTC
jgi:hypothetical protein